MAALNSRNAVPFITYLTLFQSRIASGNVVLGQMGASTVGGASLQRKVKELLNKKVEVNVSHAPSVLSYLHSKKFIPQAVSDKSRYPGLALRLDGDTLKLFNRDGEQQTKLRVYQVDLWMSDERVSSTVGTPTSDNAEELLALCQNMGVIAGPANSRTGPGEVTQRLRNRAPDPDNPFVLGPEMVILMRQLIERDGFMIICVLGKFARDTGRLIDRDQFALELPGLTQEAIDRAKQFGRSPEAIGKAKEFLRLVQQTGSKRKQMSDAPGVLEHRMTPRLEWLVDFGALTKAGFPRNGFSYRVTDDAQLLRSALESYYSNATSTDDAVLEYWRASRTLSALRNRYDSQDARAAIRQAYGDLRRNVGPVAIRDVCLVAGMRLSEKRWTVAALEAELLSMAQSDKAINISGGRYQRSAEFVYIKE
jgi:hypothetical protein